jgi:hypothetical protein
MHVFLTPSILFCNAISLKYINLKVNEMKNSKKTRKQENKNQW